jgi:hypothetical protein
MLLVTSCGTAFASEKHFFMPDNDLWKEDNLALAGNEMTEELFTEIIRIGGDLYSPIAQQWGENLYINEMYYDSTVNASAWRDGRGNTEIRMYGGMARRAEVTPLSFALVLCHELGHLYALSPYIEPSLRLSAEGQADYGGAGWCLKNIAQQLNDGYSYRPTSYMNQLCKSDSLCAKEMVAAQGLGTLLGRLGNQAAPRFETPDPYVTPTTMTSYPKTAQCRLDTYRSAILGQSRPRCWYAGG